MAKYAVCKNCKAFYEVLPVVETIAGTTFIKTKCSECGNEIVESKNNIHYGNDGL
jgi:RNase P subunit RPR2